MPVVRQTLEADAERGLFEPMDRRTASRRPRRIAAGLARIVDAMEL
jgi:hypothetical protein